MSWETDFGEMIGIPYVDTSYDQPRTADTVVGDIVTQRQDVGTSGNDAWGGFFKSAIGSVLEYGIKRDAAMVGMELQAAQQPRQYYSQPTAAVSNGALTISPMLLIIGGLVAVMVLKK